MQSSGLRDDGRDDPESAPGRTPGHGPHHRSGWEDSRAQRRTGEGHRIAAHAPSRNYYEGPSRVLFQGMIEIHWNMQMKHAEAGNHTLLLGKSLRACFENGWRGRPAATRPPRSATRRPELPRAMLRKGHAHRLNRGSLGIGWGSCS